MQVTTQYLALQVNLTMPRYARSYAQDSKWGTTVTMLFGRARGCYGLQLDTAQGTSTIVVAA